MSLICKTFKMPTILYRTRLSVIRPICDSKFNSGHIPVFEKEVVEYLSPKKGQIFVDMTFGSGGHSRALLSVNTDVTVYALDRDPRAHEICIDMANQFPNRLLPLLGRFSQLGHLLEQKKLPFESIDGFLIDAGCSSMQLEMAERGFSVVSNGPLDMRMDAACSNQTSAADVVNTLDVKQLARIFKVYGEEKLAKKIAQAVVESRYMMKELRTTNELATLVAAVSGNSEHVDKLNRKSHPATKIFQSLRIFVNNELNELNYGLQLVHRYLRPGGRLVAITFHSLEDRIVKRHLTGQDIDEAVRVSIAPKYRNSRKWHTRDNLLPQRWNLLNKHVVLPSLEEVAVNPRSRSAKLRAATKL